MLCARVYVWVWVVRVQVTTAGLDRRHSFFFHGKPSPRAHHPHTISVAFSSPASSWRSYFFPFPLLPCASDHAGYDE